MLTSAGEEALALGHHFIAPEHLVLGLLSQPDELAAEVLAELGLTAKAVRTQVCERPGTAPPRPRGSLGVSPETKRLLELAGAIAKSLGSRCPKTEHVLLAATSPKLHSTAASVLAECGATPDKVRDQLTRMRIQEARDPNDGLASSLDAKHRRARTARRWRAAEMSRWRGVGWVDLVACRRDLRLPQPQRSRHLRKPQQTRRGFRLRTTR